MMCHPEQNLVSTSDASSSSTTKVGSYLLCFLIFSNNWSHAPYLFCFTLQKTVFLLQLRKEAPLLLRIDKLVMKSYFILTI